MRKSLSRLIYVAAIVLCGKVSAYNMTDNQRLDQAIYSGHDPKLIAAGQIEGKDTKARPGAVEEYPADVTFRFKVMTVILGNQTYGGQTLVIPATSFMWPTELVPFEEGVRCALVLRTDCGDKRDGYDLCSVVPVHNTVLRNAKDGEEAKSILEAELIEELKHETSASRQRHLILQVAPILQKAQSEALVPFLKNNDIWIRRAALAGLICATKKMNYMAMASQDIADFIKVTNPLNTINDPDGRHGYAPYPLLFSHYFFVAVGWSREEDAAAAAYLPLFRLVAHSKKVPELVRWDHGVGPLCRAGTRENAKFLYDYCQDRADNEKKEVFRSSYRRQEIIMAISRILNLGLSNWVESDFLKKEQEQHQQISDALVKEGIINKDQVHNHPGLTVGGDGKPALQPQRSAIINI